IDNRPSAGEQGRACKTQKLQKLSKTPEKVCYKKTTILVLF
ncbi:hypothetical protein THAOC_09716, partial [Thalassiosira oceanica]